VLPHLMVPDLGAALHTTHAHRVVALNLAPQVGETDGFSPQKHLDVLCAHAPKLQIDVVVADTAAVPDPRALGAAVERIGARLVLAPVAATGESARHDPERLAAAFATVFERGEE